jgi:hypothetical protein
MSDLTFKHDDDDDDDDNNNNNNNNLQQHFRFLLQWSSSLHSCRV